MIIDYADTAELDPATIVFDDLDTSAVGPLVREPRDVFGRPSYDKMGFARQLRDIVAARYEVDPRAWSISLWRNTRDGVSEYACLFCAGGGRILALRPLPSPNFDAWFDAEATVGVGRASYGLYMTRNQFGTAHQDFSKLFTDPIGFFRRLVPYSYRAAEHEADRRRFLASLERSPPEGERADLDRTRELWCRLIDLPGVESDPPDPAAKEHFERRTGMALPAELEVVYSISDGARHEASRLEFLTLEEITAAWWNWKTIFDSEPLEDLRRPESREGVTAGLYANPLWIGFALEAHPADYFSLDLLPGPEGRVGQIIRNGRDVREVERVAMDLNGFLRDRIRRIKRPNESPRSRETSARRGARQTVTREAPEPDEKPKGR